MQQQTYHSVHEQSVLHKETNDCTVKAVAIACNVPYSVAHEALRKAGRKDRKGAFRNQTIVAIKSLGFDVTRIATPKTGKTMGSIDRVLTRGQYLVFVRAHVAALVDGRVHDWTSGRKHRVQVIYQVADPNAPVVTVQPDPVPAPGSESLPKRFIGFDKYGSKIGSQSALINETLGNYKWWTVAEIATKTGLSVSRVRNHMRWLTDRGWVHIKDNNKLYQLVCKYTMKEV